MGSAPDPTPPPLAPSRPFCTYSVPFYFAFFSAYDFYTKSAVGWVGVRSKEELAAVHFAVGGGLAGSAGWALVFPMDVIKSRKQTGLLPRDMGLAQAANQIIATEGWAAASRGWLPAVLRGFPANAALFVGVELSDKLFTALGS